MKHKLFFYFFICFALPTVIWVDDAFAYLNFAGGTVLLHGLIAAITGGIFLIKVYWNKLKKCFTFGKKSMHREIKIKSAFEGTPEDTKSLKATQLKE